VSVSKYNKPTGLTDLSEGTIQCVQFTLYDTCTSVTRNFLLLIIYCILYIYNKMNRLTTLSRQLAGLVRLYMFEHVTVRDLGIM